jgi:murein tripeptide amidase MpaA
LGSKFHWSVLSHSRRFPAHPISTRCLIHAKYETGTWSGTREFDSSGGCQMANVISPWVATSAVYRPDRYYTYDLLTELLHAWEKEYPSLVQVESIGTTYEGRKIWALTMTNVETGHHSEKPATFVDANIHAGEVTGCATVLWLVHHLLTTYGEDETTTWLLDESVLYAVPAIMLDGMELYLTSPERLRSSVRPYPDVEPQDGLRREDLDGDGRILQMRVEDLSGPWKVSPDDPRVMIRRDPDEAGGTYYYVYEEGTIRNWDGGAIRPSEPFGLDLNRNFPHQWVPEGKQRGAGELPLGEPETRALAEFMVAHPNIGTSQHFHTWSAVILRPSSNRTDNDLPNFDLNIYKALGKMGEEVTGYRCVSIHDEFAYDKKQPIHGTVLDWIYDSFGSYAYSTELWSLPRKAGIEITDYIGWGQEHPASDDVAMAKALDEHVDGAGIYEWKPFDHPQLGKVEIGGWDYKFAVQNPPGPLLEEVTEGNALFVKRLLGTNPRLELDAVQVEPLGGDAYRVSVVVQNTGFLPTYLSEVGKAIPSVKGVRVKLELPHGATIEVGKPEADLGHLEGRANVFGPMGIPPRYGNLARAKAEWVVKAAPGTSFELTAHATKAGTVRQNGRIPASED